MFHDEYVFCGPSDQWVQIGNAVPPVLAEAIARSFSHRSRKGLPAMTGRSGTGRFSPRARLLKLIGAELISDEVVAITELVKNAHDADASAR